MFSLLRSLRLSLSAALLLFAAPAFAVLDGDVSKADPRLKFEAYRLVGKPAGKPSAPAATLTVPAEYLAPNGWAGATLPKNLKPVADKGMVTTEVHNGETYLDTFIKLAPGATTDGLKALGVIVGSQYGDILLADIKPESLDLVNALPEVLRIEGAAPGGYMNDNATLETGTQTVWNSPGYRGSGVWVGVMDSGIDWTHGDFKDAQGNSRIQYIWDQTDTGGPNPAGYAYGSEWTKANIDAGTPREQDNDAGSGGHGTHVAGTAAGDGSATGNGQAAGRFVGVANQSDILFVKQNDSQKWVDGVAWMFGKATAAGKPIAVNMSLGFVYGPHDGSTLMEQGLDNLIGNPGQALIIAAANSGGQVIHAFSTLAQHTGVGNTLEETPLLAFAAYNAPPQNVEFKFSSVEMYYPAGQSVEWRVLWPTGAGLVASDWTGGLTESKQYTIQDTGQPSLQGVQVFVEAQTPFNDGRNIINYGGVFVVAPQGQGTPYLNGKLFYIQLKGPGVPVHAWHTNRDQGSFVPPGQGAPALLIEPDDLYTLGSPGTAGEAITIGAYTSKVTYTDSTGATQNVQGATLGQIAGFSSRGPRRDGNSTVAQQKPDICAPGEVLISTLSSVLAAGRPATSIERDGVHQSMQGTSMAAPFVTGVVALMLQKNPTLTASQIKTILRSSAREAGTAGWDPIYGAGKIDVVAAINAVQGTGGVTRGDVNGDAQINAADGILVSRHVAGIQTLAGNALTAADADQSGAVNQTDVDWILEKKVGLR